jgi:hypothetical protein
VATIVSGLKQPKDYALKNLLLLSSTSSFDIKNMMVEISYNEDIFSNACSGYVMIIEAMGYIESLALNGTEYLRLTFSKGSNPDGQIDKVFRVYKLAKRKLEGNPNKESYILYFCSDEMLLSEQYKINKAYKNTLVSNNIKDILTNYLKVPSNRIGTIEDSYGTTSFIIPRLKPFDAINWMQIYARPNASNPGADMLCYEDKNGYHFRSLQTLMKQSPYFAYTYKPKNLDSTDLQSEVTNVTTYEILDSFDTLNGIHSGMFANKLISVNPLTRSRIETKFDYADYQNVSKKLNSYPLVDNSTNRLGDQINKTADANLKLVFSNFGNKDLPKIAAAPGSTSNDIYAETYIPFRTAQLALANYTRVRISVPGDTNLTVGKVITFNLASRKPGSKVLDRYYSGNYLVTGVRHLISLTEYKTILEITKESVPNPYPNNNNETPLWGNTVKGNI